MSGTAFFAAEDAIVRNVTGPASARIWHGTRVEDTVLGEHVIVADGCRVGGCELGEHVTLQRNSMAYHVRLGRYSYTGKNATLWHADIGAFCSLSWNVSIGGADHDYTRLTTHSFLYDGPNFGLLPEGEEGYDRFSEPCAVGNDVWIAANACICRGVTVGTGAVVAAGAVVTRDVAPYTIVAGVPARPIKTRFSDDIIARLLDTGWWELPPELIRENFALFNARPDGGTLSALEEICRAYRGKDL